MRKGYVNEKYESFVSYKISIIFHVHRASQWHCYKLYSLYPRKFVAKTVYLIVSFLKKITFILFISLVSFPHCIFEIRAVWDCSQDNKEWKKAHWYPLTYSPYNIGIWSFVTLLYTFINQYSFQFKRRK